MGAALYEEYVYNDECQPQVSTFVDYLMPTIHEVPMTRKDHIVTPSPVSPLGAKGCGEGAMHTTPATILCAINDALAPLLEARSGKDVELDCLIDKSLLGGVVVEMDGVIIDGSLKKKLAEIKDVMNR